VESKEERQERGKEKNLSNEHGSCLSEVLRGEPPEAKERAISH